jgi:hypothetical protein
VSPGGVLWGDVDEVPSPEGVRELLAAPRAAVFLQQFRSTRLGLWHPAQPWLGTVSVPWGQWRHGTGQHHRNRRPRLYAVGRVVEHGGWHLSWMGTDEERLHKLHTFGHGELVGTFDPTEGRRTGRHANGERLEPAPRWARLPEPIEDGRWEVPASWT